jgi:isopentenyl-diphosphate delta-isomerase
MMDAQPTPLEMLNLVNENDLVVGYLDKESCHDGDGVLHRAFSVLLLDSEGRLLLQRRNPTKRLWGHYWSNSCCSHPRRGEQTQAAAERRLVEELGIRSSLRFLYRFRYQASFGSAGAEHELCHVFAGLLEGDPTPNPLEVSDCRMSGAQELDRELDKHAPLFTPWFKKEWGTIRREHWDTIKALAD